MLRWEDKGSARFSCPAILHVRADARSNACDHFITCFGERDDYLCIADYPHPPVLVPRGTVLEKWEGGALYVDDAQGRRIAEVSAYRLQAIQIGTLLLVLVSVASLIFYAAVTVCCQTRVSNRNDTRESV
jgi:hypothetical protein